MRLSSLFSPKKHETALGFGLSWSLVGSAIALTYLASCAYIVPENPRPPRYNTVLGEKRLPPKNPSPANNFTMPEAQQQQYRAPAMQPQPAPQSVPHSQLTPQPPRQQEQSFVQNTTTSNYAAQAPAAAPTTQEDYSWWNPRGWFGDAQPAQPRNTPVVRQTPAAQSGTGEIVSYQTPSPMMQPLPDADGYPTLQNTPPSPLVTGQAQARDKLNYARSDMEAELDAANARAGQLRNEANAAPSIMSTMTEYSQPAPAAAPAPIPEPAPMPSVTRPSSIVSNDLPPPAKVVEPVAKTASVSSEVVASEPIQLKPPTGKGTPVETDVGMTTSMSTMAPSTSEFDPMAGSNEPITLNAPTGTYAGKKYLPESRYVTRRTY